MRGSAFEALLSVTLLGASSQGCLAPGTVDEVHAVQVALLATTELPDHVRLARLLPDVEPGTTRLVEIRDGACAVQVETKTEGGDGSFTLSLCQPGCVTSGYELTSWESSGSWDSGSARRDVVMEGWGEAQLHWGGESLDGSFELEDFDSSQTDELLELRAVMAFPNFADSFWSVEVRQTCELDEDGYGIPIAAPGIWTWQGGELRCSSEPITEGSELVTLAGCPAVDLAKLGGALCLGW